MTLLKPLTLLFFSIILSACSDQSKEIIAEDKTAALTSATNKDQSVKKYVKYSAESFFETTTIYGSNINASGDKILLNSDESGIFNSYAMSLEGGAKTPLTHSKSDFNIGVSWFPKDDRIIYRADQGGNELDHLFVLELDGTIKDLTPGEKLRARFVSWTADGASFYLTTNERDAKFFDLYRYKVSDYSRQLVFQNNEGYSIDAISSNGRWLALGKVQNNANSNIFLADLESDETIPSLISEHDGSANFNALIFTRDNSSLVYSTDQKGEYSEAWTYTINDKKHNLLAKDNWDIFYVNYSVDGRYQIIGINADNSPSNLFIYDMDGTDARQLTQALNPKMSADELVTSTVIRFKSFDELLIPSLEYKPKEASAINKVPALLWIHGGPGGQSTKGYRAEIQHLVNHGYAILAVNNRGSSGYGKTFYHLDDKKHGEDDLQDIVYAKRYLETLDWVEHENIGIIGGSYGGYMTMAAMTFTDEFEIGINIFGVTNWERTLKNIPPWWESFKEYLYAEMGDPATDSERHRKISPLFHADKITKPVLVVQGANDPRVLQIESDEMVAAIKANNVPVEYILFPDEGHGFRKKTNRITASNAYVEFLKKHLN